MTMRFKVGDIVRVARTLRMKSKDSNFVPPTRVGVIIQTTKRFAVLDYGHYRETIHWDELELRILAAQRDAEDVRIDIG
jgi:hypothetical protein